VDTFLLEHTDHVMNDRSIWFDFRHFGIFFSPPQPSKILGLRRIRSRVRLQNFAGGEAAGTWP